MGSFEILRLIGEGKRSSVYLAFDRHTRREVAIKVLEPTLAQDPANMHRFQQEGEITRQLNHPNIVRVEEVGGVDGFHYVAMAYAGRGTLADWLEGQSRPFVLARTTHLLQGVAVALDYAHAQHVLHGNIKPSNILITEDRQGMLSDFAGPQRLHRSGVGSQWDVVPLGDLTYLAPEQVRPEGVINERTDIYQLGVIAYQMLTGRLPFDATHRDELLRQIARQAPTFSRDDNRQLPKGVRYALLRALAKDPNNRYQSATEFVVALANGVAQQPNARAWAAVQAAVGESKPDSFYRFFLVALGITGLFLVINLILVRPLAFIDHLRPTPTGSAIGTSLLMPTSTPTPLSTPTVLPPTSTPRPEQTTQSTAGGEATTTATPTVPATPSPTPDLLALIEEQLRKLSQGVLLFNPPSEMTIGATERVEVRIQKNISPTVGSVLTASLVSGLTGGGVPTIEPIKVGTFMRARLSGEQFTIAPRTEEEQLVGEDGYTQWIWDISPLRSGSQTLNLTVDVVIRAADGLEKSKTYAVKDKVVVVRVNPVYTTREFLATYWLWLAALLLACVLLWLLYKRQRVPQQVVIQTEGGAYIGGNVSTSGGEFTGRDQSIRNELTPPKTAEDQDG